MGGDGLVLLLLYKLFYILLNKINVNSSVNIPPINLDANLSLNEKNLQQKKEQSDDYFDNEVSYQDEDDNDPIFKEYTMINNKRNKVIDDIKNINERIKNNNIKIEEIKQNLNKLKEEKKQKQIEIVNLLSNKESIEEVYKHQIYSINSQHNGGGTSGNNLNENNDINNLVNISMKNDINDNSAINLNSNHNITLDNEISNNDEDNFKIDLNEIKESDQKKYIEQVIYMFEDLYKKRDDKFKSSISNTIIKAYESFINDNNEEKENDSNNNNELIVANFFEKISSFISSYIPGKYPESKINLFLRYLLKINAINVKLTQYIKFVNKKYKEKKKELIDIINFLEKKNITLSEKNNRLEDNMKEYEDKLEFFGNNDVFEIEQKFEKDDDMSDDNYNQRRRNNKNRKEIDNFEKNEDQLSHDVVIEYEDGIDQNVEINYEEDDLANEYDYEKEKEMINKGLNPYNSENNQNNKFNTKKHSVLNKERIIANNKNRRLIINDNDESDKYLKEFLQNKDERKTNNKRNKNKKSENADYLFVSDIDNKDLSDISDDNKKPKKQTKKKLTDYNYQLVKKNVFSIKSTMPSNNVISDNRIYPTSQQRIKSHKDLEKLSAMELEHYNRVQRIMNAGPKVNNIFGINNYNPENSINSINVGSDIVFSPKKNVSQLQTSSNKIDKTIRIGSKQNHNFISIINMTKNVPLKKKKEKDKTRMKEKRKESRGNDEGIIQIINLEENFLNELKEEEKNENEKLNKTGNESTSNITNNNNSKRNNSNSNEIIDNDDNSKNNINSYVSKNNNNNNNNNKNEVQGYYINIINTKQQNKEKEKKEINVINVIEEKDKDKDKEKEDNNLKNKKNESNELFINTSKKTLKITKSRELNINDLKNNKIMNKKISKTNIPKNVKAKAKLIYLNTAENKAGSTLNNTGVRPKTNNSSNKIVNRKIISNINISGNYVNINDSSIKRSHSISDNLQNKKEEIKNKFNNRRIIVNNNNSNNIININISPNIQKNRKISNIPLSKIKNTNSNHNTYTYEGNIKNDAKIEYPNNRIKK